MNPQLNKKVKKYLDSYFRDTKKNSPEHHEAVMLVMRGALTDANFHSEAKELGKYFPKASKKYIGTPMEDVIEDKGIDIAKMAKWDGHDIIDAFAFYLSMSIGGSFGNRLMSLKESLEESLVSEGERLDEKNCPTDASKWSYYKSQAKQKFDVYPSAYANGWASKQYKAAGGGWKQCAGESMENTNENFAVHMMVAKAIADQKVKNPETKKDVRVTTALKDKQHPAHGKAKSLVQRLKDKFSKKESIDEKMITPQRGHNYYQLTKDTPIKYISGHSGIGLEVPGVLLHNEYDTFKGKKGAYIIDYFGRHFYVDIKNKFASDIANPRSGEQNKDLMRNAKSVDKAPEFSDWKKYMNESVNEANTIGKMAKRYKNKDKFISAFFAHMKKNYGDSFKDFEKDKKYRDSISKIWDDEHGVKESVNEGISVFDERHFGKKGIIIMIDDNGKKVSAIFKDKKNADKFNRNNPSDIKKLLQLAKSKKFPQTIDESVNEVNASDIEIGDFIHLKSKNKTGMVLKISGNKVTINTPKGKITGDLKDVQLLHQDNVNEYIEPQTKKIAYYTGTRPEAVKDFVSKHGLNITKLLKFVEKGKLADRMKLVSAIAGRPNNPVQKQIIKQFSESLIKEAKVKLGKDVVNFRVSPNVRDVGLTLLAASGNDLDKLQDAIANDVDVKSELLKMLEKQLKLPMNIDYGYQGAGFAFKFDLYSIAKKVK